MTVGLLPPGVRRQYGFSWDPARALARRGGAEYLKRVVVPLLPQRRALRAQRAGRSGLTPRGAASAPGPQAAQPAAGDARDRAARPRARRARGRRRAPSAGRATRTGRA